MPNEVTPFLNVLDKLLGDHGKATLYHCIRDLVEHGLDSTRFATGEKTPFRQDITQYLAAWSRHAGLSEEEASAWLVDYCSTRLAVLSRRTPAAVRHSTKSNLRYIYRSAVPFLCHGAENPFRAHCRPDCPVYADMADKLRAQAIESAQPRPVVRPPDPVIVSQPVKVANREQFQTGLRLALDEVGKGTTLALVVKLLNARGLKTRTGRQWRCAGLRDELQAWKDSQVPPPDGGPATPVAGAEATEGPPAVS
jgi:hypothetical protein